MLKLIFRQGWVQCLPKVIICGWQSKITGAASILRGWSRGAKPDGPAVSTISRPAPGCWGGLAAWKQQSAKVRYGRFICRSACPREKRTPPDRVTTAKFQLALAVLR